MTCEKCRFGFFPCEEGSSYGDEGQCRISPPNSTNNLGIDRFPVIFRSDWCGKFQEKGGT